MSVVALLCYFVCCVYVVCYVMLCYAMFSFSLSWVGGELLAARGADEMPKLLIPPVKSEPPTPCRAPDSQFRKMQDQLNYVRSASLLNAWGWGRGFLFHRWVLLTPLTRHGCPVLLFLVTSSLSQDWVMCMPAAVKCHVDSASARMARL